MKNGDLYPSYSGLSAVETAAQLTEVLGSGELGMWSALQQILRDEREIFRAGGLG
jgi:hypothetical protein